MLHLVRSSGVKMPANYLHYIKDFKFIFLKIFYALPRSFLALILHFHCLLVLVADMKVTKDIIMSVLLPSHMVIRFIRITNSVCYLLQIKGLGSITTKDSRFTSMSDALLVRQLTSLDLNHRIKEPMTILDISRARKDSGDIWHFL